MNNLNTCRLEKAIHDADKLIKELENLSSAILTEKDKQVKKRFLSLIPRVEKFEIDCQIIDDDKLIIKRLELNVAFEKVNKAITSKMIGGI